MPFLEIKRGKRLESQNKRTHIPSNRTICCWSDHNVPRFIYFFLRYYPIFSVQLNWVRERLILGLKLMAGHTFNGYKGLFCSWDVLVFMKRKEQFLLNNFLLINHKPLDFRLYFSSTFTNTYKFPSLGDSIIISLL